MGVNRQDEKTPDERDEFVRAVGMRLRDIRKGELKWSQEEFARRAKEAGEDKSWQQWGKWERGEQEISVGELWVACRTLGVEPRDVLPGVPLPEPQRPTPQSRFEVALLEALRAGGFKAAIMVLVGELRERE